MSERAGVIEPDTMRSGALCMGYGGLEIALEQVLNVEPVWCAEFDDAPSQVIEHHWPGLPNHRDLTAIDWSLLEPVELITAGYPCQPFSHAGRREGTNDARHLWPYIAECLRVLRPRLAVFENVAGHLSLGLDTVLADLAGLGFDAEWVVVRASDVGACHQRARLFIVAADTSGGEPERWRGLGQLGATPPGAEGEARERQRVRDSALDRGEDAADARSGRRLGGPEVEGDGRRQTVGSETGDLTGYGGASQAAADACGDGRGRGAQLDGTSTGRLDGASGRHADGRGVEAARRARLGEDESATDADDLGREGAISVAWRDDSGGDPGPVWGEYEPAIRRHELVLGRPAPTPVDAKGRLAPAFVEWMQMLPEGWVTDVPDLSRAKLLKLLGNGVVPPQAAYAVQHLLGRLDERIAA